MNYEDTKMRIGDANSRNDILQPADFELLELHRDFKVKKAFIGTGHGVVASDGDDWRTRANKRPLKFTRKQVDSLPIPSIR